MQDSSFLLKEKSPESQLQGEINYEKSFKQNSDRLAFILTLSSLYNIVLWFYDSDPKICK